jgi:signal transduction histidine kinase
VLEIPVPPDRRQRLLIAVAAGACCFVGAYAAATVAGVSADLMSSIWALTIPLVPAAAWWAFARAPADLRVLVGFLAAAATLWLAGSLDWYYHFVAAGGVVPSPAGRWVAVFLCAYVVAGIGVYLTLRGAISLRRAALGSSIVGAAGIAVGAAVAGRGFEAGVTAESAVTVVQALAGVAVVTLLVSAALASRSGLPLSIAVFGAGQALLTLGHVVFSVDAVGSPALELRWPQVAWQAGVVCSILAACVIALGADRPVRFTSVAGSHRTPYGVFAALALTVGVAVYGQATGAETVLLAGLAASAWIGAAAALMTSDALRALGRANARLLELDRLKDDLLSSVSHDLRLPLVSIFSSVELLLDDAHGEQRRLLAAVDRNSQRMLHMVDDLLLAARLRSGGLELELAPVDLAEEARSCVEGLAAFARTKRIAVRVDAAHAVVHVDSARLAQALDNLVSNAIKFTPPHGEVDVRVYAAADEAVVEVADSGPGIAETDRLQVFDPFFRSASAAVRSTYGIGLGLHLVKAIVEAHAGSVEVETATGAGSTFRVRLPASADSDSRGRVRFRSETSERASAGDSSRSS